MKQGRQSGKKQSKSFSAQSLSSGSGSSKVLTNGLPRPVDVNNSHRISSPVDNSLSLAGATQSTPLSRLSSLPTGMASSAGKKNAATAALHNAEIVQPVGVSANHNSVAETPALSHSAKVW